MLEFRETEIFTRDITSLLTDDEYAELQGTLIVRPEAGDLIPGTSGLRKLRWSQQRRGKGKRGGSRVIYYWAVSADQLLLLLIYSKSERDDLTPQQLRTLKRIVEEEYP